MCQILQNCHVTSTQMSCRWERTQSAPEPCWLRWLHCRGRWHSHSVSCLLPGRFLCLLITLISLQLSQCCPLFSLYKCFFTYKGFSLSSSHASGHAWRSMRLSPLVTGAAGDQENNTQISSGTDCTACCLQDLIRCKLFSGNNPNPY